MDKKTNTTTNTETKKIMVERDTYEKDGKTYFSYFIKGTIRGKEVRIAVVPPDRSAYAVLDVVFGDAMKADLVVRPFEFKDQATGNVVKGKTYAVHTEEDGEIYECTIKPFRTSDKLFLNMLLK